MLFRSHPLDANETEAGTMGADDALERLRAAADKRGMRRPAAPELATPGALRGRVGTGGTGVRGTPLSVLLGTAFLHGAMLRPEDEKTVFID